MTTWRRAVIAGFVLLLIFVYWIAICAPGVGIYHDDGIYVVTAKALAEGKGYRIISLPDELVQTKYPILFPSLLAVVWKIFPKFPQNAVPLKMVPLLGTLLWVWLTAKFIREKENNTDLSNGIVLTTLASPWVVFFSVVILSETIFASLITAALIYLTRLEENTLKKESHLILASSFLAAAAFLTRTAGLPLLFVGMIVLLFRRRIRTSVLFSLLFAICVSPWILWQTIHQGSYGSVTSYYTSANYQQWNILFHYPLSTKIEILGKNLVIMMFAPTILLSLDFRWFGTLHAASFVTILGTSFSLFGFFRDFRTGIKSIHIFLVLYHAMLLVWVWPPIRFMVPIFPFWLFYAYKGFASVCASFSLSERSMRIANNGLAILVWVCLGGALYLSSSRIIYTGQASPLISNIQTNENYNWAGVRFLLDWISENTPRDSVILGNLDPVIYLYTGRKAVRGFVADPYLLCYADQSDKPLGSENDLLEVLITQKVDYIIRIPDVYFREVPIFNGILDRISQKDEEILTVIKEGPHPGYEIYRANRQRLMWHSHLP